ncbi:ABC transporter substrate-binding protein [Roseomonas sp. CCTCC AB2023176]|uniref:ABC transporter substrate-binding protein n=1 Tax=Roseomonas sp. CCTCC AB2023176 TaxID=3342640 RepID=UPI0035E1AEC2
MPDLSVAIGRYNHSAAALDGGVASPLVLHDAGIKPISRAFAPMVREGRFEVSEMAIATFLMAKAWGKPLVLLPVVMAARFQEGALLCRADGPVRAPGDLRGRRVGVRAYSQTTGLWLRGTLQHEHGVAPDGIRWVTFEDAHVAEYADPSFVERAPPGSDLLALLKDGTLDAAIFGNDTPDDRALRPVFPDVAAAGEAFRTRHGFVPVNHLLVLRRDVAESRPDIAAELVRLFNGTTRAALNPAIELAIRFSAEQDLLPRPLTTDEVWEGLPPEVA